MIPRLTVKNYPFKTPWMPDHAGCKTRGRVVVLTGDDKVRHWFSIVQGRLDRECAEAMGRRSRQKTNLYGLTWMTPWPTGRLLLKRNEEHIVVKTGWASIGNPLDLTTLESVSSGLLYLHVSQSFLRMFRDFAGFPSSAGPLAFGREPIRLSSSVLQAVHRILQLVEGGASPLYNVHLWAAAWTWLAAVWETHPHPWTKGIPPPAAGDPRLQRAVDYLHQNMIRSVTIEALAETSGMSAPTLRRRFHERFQCGPATYRRRLRVEWGERLMAEDGSLKTDVLARAVGYRTRWAWRRAYRRVRKI